MIVGLADQNSAHLVELYLDVDITKFTEENKVHLTAYFNFIYFII